MYVEVRMLSDIEIARTKELKDIREIAKRIDLDEGDLKLYGKYMAKVEADCVFAPNKKSEADEGALILVTATSPTKAGEGKSTMSIALADALNRLKHKTLLCLREPSMGPVFGLKGGATGGGYAQVMPMDDINLHFTGDMHAITAANNLISASIDNHLYWGNELGIDKDRVLFKRCLDVNDRSLRKIEISYGFKKDKFVRTEQFNISVASEIMATLCLAKDFTDLKDRLARIAIAYDVDGKLLQVKDLGIVDSLLLILKDAILPNLVQTLEENPVLIHGGPFANIAHGCNSIVATKFALRHADYVVTEAGFAADLGAEKFLDIKSQVAKLNPRLSVLVTTIRSLKSQAYIDFSELNQENIEALKIGLANLDRHMQILQNFNLPFVVAINQFDSDTEAEKDFISHYLTEKNIDYSFVTAFRDGAEGALSLAKLVYRKIESAKDKNERYEPLYNMEDSFESKLNSIVKKCYGARSYILSAEASSQLTEIKRLKYENLPLCIAKTANSFTDDPKILGAPSDFDIHISELRLNLGAGFIVCLTGRINTLPGLPKKSKAEEIYYKDGKFFNLS